MPQVCDSLPCITKQPTPPFSMAGKPFFTCWRNFQVMSHRKKMQKVQPSSGHRSYERQHMPRHFQQVQLSILHAVKTPDAWERTRLVPSATARGASAIVTLSIQDPICGMTKDTQQRGVQATRTTKRFSRQEQQQWQIAQTLPNISPESGTRKS